MVRCPSSVEPFLEPVRIIHQFDHSNDFVEIQIEIQQLVRLNSVVYNKDVLLKC